MGRITKFPTAAAFRRTTAIIAEKQPDHPQRRHQGRSQPFPCGQGNRNRRGASRHVCGSWRDAGDFDRRTYHFQVVDSLLSIYLLFPENFKDAQLDLPESGNGIPGIIDEAAWGVEV